MEQEKVSPSPIGFTPQILVIALLELNHPSLASRCSTLRVKSKIHIKSPAQDWQLEILCKCSLHPPFHLQVNVINLVLESSLFSEICSLLEWVPLVLLPVPHLHQTQDPPPLLLLSPLLYSLLAGPWWCQVPTLLCVSGRWSFFIPREDRVLISINQWFSNWDHFAV